MHILFTRFPLESALGGAEIQTLSLMEGLMERGHTIEFAGSCPTLLAECKKRNIQTTELHIGKPPVTKWGAVSFVWNKQSMQRKLRLLLENFGKDTSHESRLRLLATSPTRSFWRAGGRARVTSSRNLRSHDSQLNAIVMLSLSEKLLLTPIAVDAEIPVFWVEHDRIGRWLTMNPWLPLLRKQSTKAMTIVVSELSKKLYLKMGWEEENVVAIANGIASPPNPLSFPPTCFPGEGELLRLGCIARLSHEKGVDVLIQAMADLPQNIQLEIIGTGREASSLKQLAHRLKVDNRITFTSREKNIADAYARWDALVLPSRDHDPFGMVAAEAMLAGLPVIVTNQCGIADYLEDGKDAMIVEADSSTALAAGIEKIGVMSHELRENGQKTAKEKFSVKTMVKRYEDVFTGVHQS